MRKPFLWIAGIALVAVPLGAAAADHCRYSAPRAAEIDAAGLKALTLQIGPDDLTVRGQPGLGKILVRGTACASNPKWLDAVKMDATRQGDTASVIAHDRNHGFQITSWFGGSYAYLKLNVQVPSALAVKLLVGSGDADIGGVAALDASVGSGDLKVNGVTGQFALRLGSGDVVASQVGGLKVGSIGSGDFSIRNIGGNAAIGSIGSGDAKLTDIAGGLTLQSMGSGDVTVHDVKRDVTVGSLASGGLKLYQIGGDVHAGSIGSGDFAVDGVSGNLSVGTVGSGDVEHRNVKGKVSVPRDND
ncbi:MAG: hypothetical protein EPN38_02090 [Rhodanobacteraceae bacterium]|nr:MAG: hypothetical protein EPN38_02090 [Rhodanobacteraceae bacterium]